MQQTNDPAAVEHQPGPQLSVFPAGYSPSAEELELAVRPMILSASGWRKVFAADGDEESRQPAVRPVDLALCACMADVFYDFLNESSKVLPLNIAIGTDSRFTGAVIADVILRVLATRNARVTFLGIVAAPEIMAHVQASKHLSGFIYVSASHNPIGHNGVKFGLDDGGVVGGFQAASLIADFRIRSIDAVHVGNLVRLAEACPPEALQDIYRSADANRLASRASYFALSAEVFTLESDKRRQKSALTRLQETIRKHEVGILAEFNGSARSLTIDREFLEGLGARVRTLNSTPGEIVHRIVPEGRSLDLCREELMKLHGEDPAFVLGYVPDCDGDRGNLVYYDDRSKTVEILEAQQVFALCVLSELAGLAYFGQLSWDEEGFPHQRVAVACNDPTSLRVNRIADAFGARVFRAEVGEANVVKLARNLRTQDWIVRILGEGSNGGNITHPGSVRDPLSTLGSILKLITIRSKKNKPGLFEIWCERSGLRDRYKADFTLTDVIETLPNFITTSAYEDRAILKIRTQNQAQLKAAYEKYFTSHGWKDNFEFLKNELGIYAWEEINYEGSEERHGFGPPFRSGKESGGLKILLKDSQGRAKGFVWMRGSGTEPVFRVMADIEGQDPFLEEWLLNWHVGMILKVD